MARKSPVQLITFRLPQELSEQVRQIEAREYESRSNVLRRLIRVGLEADDRRQRDRDEAA